MPSKLSRWAGDDFFLTYQSIHGYNLTMLTEIALGVVLAIVCVLFLLKERYASKNMQLHAPLPPGPPAAPLIGHLHLMPAVGQDLFFYELSKRYGKMIHLRILNRHIIVLNSVQAAAELLDKRNYRHRPALPIWEMLDRSLKCFCVD
ncbi:hypothetical protein H0H87_003573 [Tephrocybe sp. NHM501043]|nr:hypothetical protein H0H87_003573 [Tephrocybe sp. NHM501043]